MVTTPHMGKKKEKSYGENATKPETLFSYHCPRFEFNNSIGKNYKIKGVDTPPKTAQEKVKL